MKVYVHGNCQAPALADLLASACPDFQVVSRQVYSIDIASDEEDYRRDVANADIILTQPVADNYRGTDILATSWLRRTARPDAVFLVFPVVYHRGQLPQCFTLAEYHHGRLAYHDAHAIDFFLRGLGVDEFIAATSGADFLSNEFVQAELARTTVELLRRERAGNVDVPISDIIASQLDLGQPLYTVNHPSRHVLAALADRVLARLGRSERALSQGVDMLDLFVMPPYLSTALALGHGGQGVWLNEVRADGIVESRQDFFTSVFQDYAKIGAPALKSAVAQNQELVGYLDRFRRVSRSVVPFDRAEFVDSLYQVFFGRAASSDEVLHHLQTAINLGTFEMIAAFPGSEEFRNEATTRAFMARFESAKPLPRPLPSYRIPHPTPPPSAEVSGRRPLMQRLRTAMDALIGRDGEIEPSVLPVVAAAVQTPTANEIVLEATAILPPADLDIDQLSQPDGLDDVTPSRSIQDPVPAPSNEADHMLTIVVPMAGLGSRFAKAGYTDPKPLIPVNGVPMIKLVIDNLRPARKHRFVFICQVEHIEAYGLNEKLEAWAPGCAIVGLNGVTEGAACTVLAADAYIAGGPLIIANSDQYIEASIDDYLSVLDSGLDGLIMTMKSDDPKWSYAAVDERGLVQRVAEKEVISNHATVGIYGFIVGHGFVAGARAMIAKNSRVNGEFYVAPVYDELIAEGWKVGVFDIGSDGHGMHGLGTPADLERYLAWSGAAA